MFRSRLPLKRCPILALALALSCGPAQVSTQSEPEPITPTMAAAPRPAAPEAEPEAEPEPEPEPEAEPEPEPPSFGHADLDPDNDELVGPPEKLADCHAQLDALGVVYKKARLPPEKKVRGVYTCGSHEAVWVRHGPGEIRYSSSPLLSCPMAIALMDFEKVVQEEAQRHLGTRVVRIDFMSTYACREMARFDMVSEHSFANAMDISRFRLADRRVVSVLEDFGSTDGDPPDAKAEFLRSLAMRLFDEEVFSTVLTPYFDRLHRNHFHVDLARYRVDGSRG